MSKKDWCRWVEKAPKNDKKETGVDSDKVDRRRAIEEHQERIKLNNDDYMSEYK